MITIINENKVNGGKHILVINGELIKDTETKIDEQGTKTITLTIVKEK